MNCPDVTRREFIKKSAVGGATLIASGMATQSVLAQVHQGQPVLMDAGTMATNMHVSTILENEFLRIELNSTNGDITGLFNKRTSKEYIAEKKWARAFRLNVPLPNRVTGYNADYSANSFDSWRQTECNITKEAKADYQIVNVQYPSLESEAGKFPIEVSYSIRLSNNSDEAILQVSIENQTPHQIKEVFFPWISGVGAVESEEADAFVAPNLIRSGTELWKEHERGSNWEEYPYLLGVPNWPNGYSLSMPWMNYGSKEEGLYLASLSREGLRHMLMVQNFGDEEHPILGFAWSIPSYIPSGKSWRSPEMVLSLHRGDWHAAADKYRASLAGWYQKPTIEPEFKKAFATFNSFFTERDFMQIAELAGDIRKYGLRHLVMWNFGDYYPKVTEPDDLSVNPPRLGQFTPQWGGLARLKAANEKARDLGVTTGSIFSQRLWNKDTLTPQLRELAEKWVLRRESGDPIVESWDHQHLGATEWSNTQQSFGHLDYVMCNAVPDFRSFAIRNVTDVLSEAGYSLMFYDQAVEGNLCFSPEHDHPDVSAPCKASYNFLKPLKSAMKANNPEAILMGEGWELLSSQVLDAGWVWVPPSNPEVFRYTLPWAGAATAIDVDSAEANKYFVLGLHLAIVARGLENGKNLSDFPEFAQQVARLASFRRRTEHFWIDGIFQDDIGLRVSGAFGKVYKTRQEVAVIMANLTGKVTQTGFALDGRQYGVVGADYSMISSIGDNEEGRAVDEKTELTETRSLAPYEVIAVVFKRLDESL
jgi:hypothetical protein